IVERHHAHVHGRAGHGGDSLGRDALGQKSHPRPAAQAEIDAVGDERLLHPGVARKAGHLELEPLLGEGADFDADIDGRERPGERHRLAHPHALGGRSRRGEGGSRERRQRERPYQMMLHVGSPSLFFCGSGTRPDRRSHRLDAWRTMLSGKSTIPAGPAPVRGSARPAAPCRVTREPMMAKADDTTTTPEYEQFRELFTRRMSIRDLRPDPVPDVYVDRILEAGRWAMSGANSQPWEFIVVRDDAVKRELVEAYVDVNNDFIFWMEQMRLAELRHPAFQVEGDAAEQWERVRTRHTAWGKAPVLIVILGDGRRQWGTVLGAMTFGRHQSHLTDALSNAATLMHLAATSLGLGSQHVTIHVQEPFKRVLGVPDLLMIHHILPIGFSAIDRRPTVRRPLGEIVHYDRYDQGKYMSNRQVLGFLHELRGRTMPAYHARPAGEV